MFKWFKDLKIGNKLFLGFGTVIIVFIILSIIIFTNITQNISIVAKNVHTYEIIDHLDAMLLAVTNMESAQVENHFMLI